MSNRTSLPEYITLGQRLYILMNPRNVHVVVEEIANFLESLEACGLARTRGAADVLNTIGRIPYLVRTATVAPVAAKQLQAYMEPISRTLYAEAREKQLVAVNAGAVCQHLRDLSSRVSLSEIQQRLQAETIACIESGAYRAAVVMGWNLAYDYLRQWVFDNHLAPFNAALTANYL